MKTPDPDSIDWNALRVLRDLLMAEAPVPDPYWSHRSQLEAYDATLGARIGWKWDAVLEELCLRGWKPTGNRLYDFGCGTGIATRRFLKVFASEIESVTLYDHSSMAMQLARVKIEEEFPEVRVRMGTPEDRLDGMVLVSHLITELPSHRLSELSERLLRADSVLWVEPGSHASSRFLIEVREELRQRFSVSAPCPHQNACGLTAEGMEKQSCHHFAEPPMEVHQNAFWTRFRQELSLDLSAVAYCFLVLDKAANPEVPLESLSHQIGKPLLQPKFIRLLCCQEEDVAELVASRRTGSVLYRDIKKGKGPALFRFERRKNRITGGERIRS